MCGRRVLPQRKNLHNTFISHEMLSTTYRLKQRGIKRIFLSCKKQQISHTFRSAGFHHTTQASLTCHQGLQQILADVWPETAVEIGKIDSTEINESIFKT